MNNTNVLVVSYIEGVTGSKSITNMWQHHFKSFLNSSSDNSRKKYVLNKVANVGNDNCYIDRFTIEDVMEAMTNFKCDKACGLDGIYEKHLKYVNGKLHILLALLFNALIIYGHVPKSLIGTTLVPVLKDKKGNLNEKDNY